MIKICTRLRALFAFVVIAFCANASGQSILDSLTGGGQDEEEVRATLIADTTAVQPGTSFTLGVLFTMKPGWHIYWTNPGEVGYASTVQWQIPGGSVGATMYPAPIEFVSPGDLKSFGYEDEVLLYTDAMINAADKLSGRIEVRAKAKWLMCSDRCIPGKAELSLELPVGEPAAANARLFQHSAQVTPRENTALPCDIRTSMSEAGGRLMVDVTVVPKDTLLVGETKLSSHGTAAAELRQLRFFPEKVKGFVVDVPSTPAPDQRIKVGEREIAAHSEPATFRFTLAPQKRNAALNVQEIPGVLVAQPLTAEGKLSEPVVSRIVLKRER
jgi:DsbC/DsbD-like thiol-disulfide interchange protein